MITVSAIIERAMAEVHRPEYADRAWLAVEMAALIGRAAWGELGALAVHAALAPAPLAGDLAARIQEHILVPVAGASWSDPTWVASATTAAVAALVAADSDLQNQGLKLASMVARIS